MNCNLMPYALYGFQQVREALIVGGGEVVTLIFSVRRIRT